MPVTKLRDHAVLFRLTEEEHEALKQECAIKGGRSLSEFARTELLNPARFVNTAPLHEMLADMHRRMSILEGQYKNLAGQIESLQPVLSEVADEPR
jgi:hypothetical protein